MSKAIGIVGYGNQGSAWAQNLRDSGWEVRVFLRPDSPSRAEAEKANLDILPLGSDLGSVPILAILIPDDAMPRFQADFGRHLRARQGLVFAHGFSLLYKTARWPREADWILVAPKGIGTAVRRKFQDGSGVPAVLAVGNDATGTAWNVAEEVAQGIGSGRVGTYRATIREEVEADLFSEQALLCGGLPAMIAHTYDVLVRGGIRPEVAYLECVHELAFIVDLIQERGISETLRLASPTARFGGVQGGKRVITPAVRLELERLWEDIRSGRFQHELTDEANTGFPVTREALDQIQKSSVETVGREVRKRMNPQGGTS
ncbi:MAG: ketol-acid reductoisomerase [Pseudomonadota bacterium]